ncbi:hypothetical protein [Shewanella colwelliana]|uniref:hypothetical protein n=1 Tax=Shewanella colwelliana TaxID=23 RepID=UPI0022AFEC14|nr:hypothetical protein [Shewanella colwelliana]MCZ4336021.1 hypothetical protein [Shewanella colwelliana]
MRISLIVLLLFLVCVPLSWAGQVVVRKSSEPFDAFAVRDKVLQEHAWQESLRLQQQIQVLQALPIGCVLIQRPYRYYGCGAVFYRPYHYQDTGKKSSEVFIQIDPPEQ